MNTLTSVVKHIHFRETLQQNYDLDDKTYVIIQNESTFNPYSKDILISDYSVRDDDHLFASEY